MNNRVTTYCGLDCDDCDYKGKCNCGGCRATKGQPFYGECKLAQCAIKHKVRFCGECPEFSCNLLTEYSFNQEQGDNGARIERCKEIKTALVAQAREGVFSVGYCGHHCDFCFMGKWCGGCRSNYNCCSFATLFKDGQCPNAQCCKEKNLEGCYECDELITCEKGYYGNYTEYVAKASAVFIHKYGVDCYKDTLEKAINDGVNYPKSFDAKGSVKGALALFEKYRMQDDLW